MFNRFSFASSAGQGSSKPSTLLSTHHHERVVKDQVKSRPVRDQYADLAKASERLTAGKSVLSNVEIKQRERA